MEVEISYNINGQHKSERLAVESAHTPESSTFKEELFEAYFASHFPEDICSQPLKDAHRGERNKVEAASVRFQSLGVTNVRYFVGNTEYSI